jgi:hypothetical protein
MTVAIITKTNKLVTQCAQIDMHIEVGVPTVAAEERGKRRRLWVTPPGPPVPGGRGAGARDRRQAMPCLSWCTRVS